jgi:hypothetical protein
MKSSLELAVLVFLFRTKVIDAWTLIELAANSLSQYSGVVITEMVANGGPTGKAFLTPFEGLFIEGIY